VRPWQRSSAGDPLVGGAGITVRNIDGHVALSGTVPGYPQHRQAAEAAWQVAGVTSVHIHVEVVPRVTTVTTPC
jgi:osmotically-inducible protein OsmY